MGDSSEEPSARGSVQEASSCVEGGILCPQVHAVYLLAHSASFSRKIFELCRMSTGKLS